MTTINITQAMALATLQLDREVSRLEIAEAIEMSRQFAIKHKASPLTIEQIIKINEKLGVNLPLESNKPINPNKAEKFEIKYWGEGLPCEDKLKNPLITSIWLDKELIQDGWQKSEKDLNIIAMPGDKMDGGTYPLKNGDILIIDKSQTDISISGVYFYTTSNNEEVFVNNFRKQFDGTIVLGVTNPKYEDLLVTAEQLEAAGVNIIGRIIKNLFLMM